MSGEPGSRRRARGEIEILPSGSLRVRVYAGIDPATGKRRYLMETVPAGPGAAQRAESVRVRLLGEARRRSGPSSRVPRAACVEVVFSGALGHPAVELMRGAKDVVVGERMAIGFTDVVREASTGRNWADDLLARRPAGIVLVDTGGMSEQHRLLGAGSVPMVVVDPIREPGPAMPAVTVANRSGAVAATEHLLALGHRRIAVISGPTERWGARERLAGVRAALAAAGSPLDDRLLRTGLWFSYEDGLSHGKDLLRLPHRPTAVICGNDLQAFGLYEAARQAGLRIPGELSVVGFDDISYARWAGPPLTTVSQPFGELGATAARMILALAAGEPVDPCVELPATLVLRESTAAGSP